MHGAGWLVALALLASACNMQLGGPYDDRSGGAPGGGGMVVGAGPSGQADALDVAARGCDGAPTGGRGAGEACSSAADCAPTCCGTDAEQWSGASCVGSVCAEGETVCDRTAALAYPEADAGDDGAEQSTCDACVHASCASEELACSGDPACSALVSCRAGCADDDCLAGCSATEGSSATADAIDACVRSSCGAVCP